MMDGRDVMCGENEAGSEQTQKGPKGIQKEGG